jgi:hypothetical protein
LLALLTTSVCFSSSPEAWRQHDKEVISSCLTVSGLNNAKPLGEIIRFDDRVGYDALFIQGTYPQSYMNNARAKVLCLFNRSTRKATTAEASKIDQK